MFDFLMVLMFKVGFFKWLDFFVIFIDLSGEFFNCVGGGSGLMVEMNVLGKDWIVCGCLCLGDDMSGRRIDCD